MTTEQENDPRKEKVKEALSTAISAIYAAAQQRGTENSSVEDKIKKMNDHLDAYWTNLNNHQRNMLEQTAKTLNNSTTTEETQKEKTQRALLTAWYKAMATLSNESQGSYRQTVRHLENRRYEGGLLAIFTTLGAGALIGMALLLPFTPLAIGICVTAAALMVLGFAIPKTYQWASSVYRLWKDKPEERAQRWKEIRKDYEQEIKALSKVKTTAAPIVQPSQGEGLESNDTAELQAESENPPETVRSTTNSPEKKVRFAV